MSPGRRIVKVAPVTMNILDNFKKREMRTILHAFKLWLGKKANLNRPCRTLSGFYSVCGTAVKNETGVDW